MRLSGIESDSLAMPSQIAVAFYEALRDGTILRRTGETLRAALTGLAIGGGSAVIVSIVLGLIPAAARLAQFSVEVLRPVPAVALIPVAILTLGVGEPSGELVGAFGTFLPGGFFCPAAVA